MTVEGSQSAQGAPAQGAPGASRQPMGTQQMRIVALVVVAAVIGVVLWFVFHHTKKHPGNGNKGNGKQVVLQLLLLPSGLKAESQTIGQRIYWAGPKNGVRYEFTQEKNGHVFVRYLTGKAKKGVRAANYLIVATYKYPNAYPLLKKLANKNAISGALKGPGGSVIYVRPHDQKSVLMAWPKTNYEVEIYDPLPTQALLTAKSGNVAPVR